MASAGIQVREAGRALRFQTESAHLVSTGSGRLSTAVTLHPLPEGRTIVGSDGNADIRITGTGVQPIHCAILNSNGEVVVHPLNGRTSIDGTAIGSPCRLVQGCTLSIGRSNDMRFNDPAEARRLRFGVNDSTKWPASTSSDLGIRNLDRKPPMVPVESRSDEADIGFLGKLNKFEMLARQARNCCVSPKVFPVGASTTSVPAERILGHSRSSSLVSLCTRSKEASRDSEMSQSLVISQTTSTTEFVRLLPSPDSSARRIQPPSPAFDRHPKYSESPKTSPSSCREELARQTGHAEDRRRIAQEERLREQELERQERLRLEEILAMCAEYERQSTLERPRQPNRIKTNGSLPRDKRPGYNSPFGSPKTPINDRRQASFSFESPGTAVSAFSESSQSCSRENLSFENVDATNNNPKDTAQSANRSFGLLNGSSINDNSLCMSLHNNNNNVNNNIIISSKSKGGNAESVEATETISSKRKGETFFGTIRLNGSRNCENIPSKMSRSFGEEKVGYEERNNGAKVISSLEKNTPLSNSCEIIENKLAISNDDLLEAIQQLSMLATKSKDVATTPKRNNTEKENAKSNEAKADKDRGRLAEEDARKYIEFLRNEKLHILSNMEILKRSIADIELHEEEINRELELERALLSAEYDSESLQLTGDEGEKIRTQMRINELEREMTEDNTVQANLQAEAKRRVQQAQQACICLEEELSRCGKNSATDGRSNNDDDDDDDDNDRNNDRDDEIEESRYRELTEKLVIQQDILESERKAFEDLEFHHLEEEASKLATREELQRHLSELSGRIEARRIQLEHLESQRAVIKNSASKDATSLERQKLAHVRKLEEARGRLRAIEDELETLAKNPSEPSEEKRSPSRQDFDRISRVTTDSPIVKHQGSLGRKTIESLKEIERNRQLHLAKQGSQVISEERRRVEELKRRVQDEVRSQWEERKMNCASFNSVESGEESSSYSTGGLTESGSGSSDGVEVATGGKVSSRKLDESISSSPGTSNHSYALLRGENMMREDRAASMEASERHSVKSVITINENDSRPMSQTSSEMESVGPLQPVKHRDKPKLQRPLTRYLPIKSASLDLRNHIETAGHQLPLIHDVTVDATTCSGYLTKMSKKFHHWNKRWFVFDRKQKSLSYYSDETSKKARGIIYFQSIEEVYVDHTNSVKSPQASLTFVIKTTTRLYNLMAPSPEAMRVWVDVVFTGAEGYREFHDE